MHYWCVLLLWVSFSSFYVMTCSLLVMSIKFLLQVLCQHFKMKDLRNFSYFLNIEVMLLMLLDSQLTVLHMSLLLVLIFCMLLIWSINICISLDQPIIILFFAFLGILKEHYFMGSISLPNLLLSYKRSLIPGLVILFISVLLLLLCFVFSIIFCHGKKRIVIAQSTTEAEQRALANTTFELLWLQQLLTDMDDPQISSTFIHAIMRMPSKLQ